MESHHIPCVSCGIPFSYSMGENTCPECGHKTVFAGVKYMLPPNYIPTHAYPGKDGRVTFLGGSTIPQHDIKDGCFHLTIGDWVAIVPVKRFEACEMIELAWERKPEAAFKLPTNSDETSNDD